MADVILHPAARREVDDALDWYAARNPRAATRLDGSLGRLFQGVGAQPARYPPIDAEFREAGVPGFPYSVVYRELASGEVEVIAVAHASRDPHYWRGRA